MRKMRRKRDSSIPCICIRKGTICNRKANNNYIWYTLPRTQRRCWRSKRKQTYARNGGGYRSSRNEAMLPRSCSTGNRARIAHDKIPKARTRKYIKAVPCRKNPTGDLSIFTTRPRCQGRRGGGAAACKPPKGAAALDSYERRPVYARA